MLRFEIFVSEDRQLRAVHLIFNFMPFSNAFQEVGTAIKAANPRLAQIDMSLPDFLAQEDLPPIELPLQRVLLEAAVLREEIASSCLLLKVEINQFYFEEDSEERADPIIQLPDSKDELDKHFTAHSPRLIVAHVDPNSEEYEERTDGPPYWEEQRGVIQRGPQVPSSYQSPPSFFSPCNFNRTRSGGGRDGSSEGSKTAQKLQR